MEKLTAGSAFKIQLQAMFIDTSFNTVATVLGNVYQSFYEAAVRCFEYVRSLNKARPTHSKLLISAYLPSSGIADSNANRQTHRILHSSVDHGKANPDEHH